MGAHAAERHDEGVQTMALALCVQLSQHDGMVGGLSNCTEIHGGGTGKRLSFKGLFNLTLGESHLFTSKPAVEVSQCLKRGLSECLRPPGHHLMEVTVGLCITNS